MKIEKDGLKNVGKITSKWEKVAMIIYIYIERFFFWNKKKIEMHNTNKFHSRFVIKEHLCVEMFTHPCGTIFNTCKICLDIFIFVLP